MLEIKKVTKSYGDYEILNNVSLKIEDGEVISIIGKSGAGKSTLLRCINKLEHIDTGKILFNGQDINDYSLIDLRQHIGIVFQEFNLFEHLTVLENITISLEKVKKMNKDEAQDIAKKLLSDIGLIDKVNSYPNELSGGQKQRVAIIRTLAMKPDIILLDEPTSALDQSMKYEVLDLIKKITKAHISLIIVTHEIEFAKKISDRIICIENGKIKRDGKSEPVIQATKSSYGDIL